MSARKQEDKDCRSNVVIVYEPPAIKICVFLRIVLTQKSFSRLVEPIIADIHHEYFEALSVNRLRYARWVSCRGYLILISAIFKEIPRSVFSSVLGSVKSASFGGK